MNGIKYGLKLLYTEHKENKDKICKLAINEIKIMSKGTTLGYYWTLVKDLIYFFVYTAFLLVMYNNTIIDTLPRMVFLASGLIPWYFIADCMGGGSASIKKRGSILTKMKFPMTIIPTYDVLSIFIKRLASFLIIIIMLTIYSTDGNMHIFPNEYLANIFSNSTMFKEIPEGFHRYLFEMNVFKVIYYLFASVTFMTAFVMLVSGFVAISKDFAELYNSIVRVMFFFVPIMWYPEMISDRSHIAGFIMKLNPLVYLIEGNRAAFTGIEGNSLEYTIYFWSVTLIIFVFGAFIQGKLRKIYADFL